MSEVKRYTPIHSEREMLGHYEGEYVLHSDYEKLKAQLEKAEEILKAYANCILDQTVHVSIPYDDLDPDDFDVIEEFSSGEPDDIGGKAREYFKEKEQV